MKFYIISVILNIMILFIPVAYYTSNSSKKENKQNEPITVNLSEGMFQDSSQEIAGNENIGEKNNKSGNNESVKNIDDTKNNGNSEKIEVSKNDEISNSQSESNSKKINNLNNQKEMKKAKNTKSISQNEQEKEELKVFPLENKKKDISQAISGISSTSPLESILSSKNTEKILQKNENLKVISKENLTNAVSTSTNISKNAAGNDKNDSRIYKTRTNSVAGKNENQGDGTNKNSKSNSFVQKVRNNGNNGKDGNNRGNINGKGQSGDNSKTGNLEKISKNSSKNHNIKRKRSTEKGEERNENVCNEGKDFTVSYNPDLSYPAGAQRLGNKGTVTVLARFRFNSSGSVSVISVSGGSSIFQQEARRAAGRIRVKIKNPETLKCTITKPFTFELK